jgi:spore maturation protein CgeB
LRFVIFTHSLVSDWNHGNAHFLRGIAAELFARGCDVRIFEPRDGWSRTNLIAQCGTRPLESFEREFPQLHSELYDLSKLDLDAALHHAHAVLVHEWNPPELIARIGEHRARTGKYRLFFHDTHHRAVTSPESIAAYDLRHYDGVLAYGQVLSEIYKTRPATPETWTWHEAADARVFYPRYANEVLGDLVWIGNWGDDERAEELREFLIRPVKKLGLRARAYGVRYPDHALRELQSAGIEYGGWLPNYRVPQMFARYRVTVHIPRRPYATRLPGIPTIRPFEAMACAIPLVSAPWHDCENLFRPGTDFLYAENGDDMIEQLRLILSNHVLSRDLALNGLETIRRRHTCAHRVDQLLEIVRYAKKTAVAEGAA